MKRHTKFLIAIILVLGGLFATPLIQADTPLESLVINGNYIKHYGTTDSVMIPTTYTERDTEFRGVWVATVYNLNMPRHTSETQYKAAFENLLDEVEESNMNAIVFQVRPTNDAFYDSAYAPWSKWLTGTEGVDPGWDVMAYMIQEAHSRGIEFHAWLNPYRVYNTTMSESAYLATLHDDNFAKQHPELVTQGNLDSNGNYPHILNPGEPAVKTYIRNVITELVTLYDVDGIHFDDYFYPYSGISSDGGTYATYKETDQTIEDWRRENVNDVVRGVKEDLDAHNLANGTTVRFGISPFGIWKNGGSVDGAPIATATMESYFDQYADSRKWVEEGWLDYINPQVYWNFQHGVAPYADVVDWWVSVVRGTGVDLIIGHAPSSANSYNWPSDELSNQLRYNQQHPEIIGDVMYSAAFLDYTHMQTVEAVNWTTTPLNTWPTSNVPTPEIALTGTDEGTFYSSDVVVTITGSETLYYKIGDGAWTLYDQPITVELEGDYIFYAKAVDGGGDESLLTGSGFTITKVNTDVPTIDVNGPMIGDNYLVGADVVITSDGEPIWVKINQGAPGEWEPYTGPIDFPTAGDYFIISKTITTDMVESAETSLFLTVQTECYDDPTHQISGTGDYPYFQDATVTLSGDNPSILYKINDGSYATYTTPLSFDTEGTYTITYKNDDSCGVEVSDTIYIDQTAPIEPILTIDGVYDGERYHTSITTLSLTHSEANVTLYYRLHNGAAWTAWTEYTMPVVLMFNATYTFEYSAVDQATNASDIYDSRIRVKIPPSEDNPYVVRNGEIVNYYQTSIPIELPTEYIEKTEEIRAIWIATVANIDLPTHTTELDYKNKIVFMLDTIEANNFNTIFFQVRPMNDAWYDSDYAPWSRYLMGVEGLDPGWDVFGFLIEEAHKRGIEVHAWLNPYRVSNGTGSKSSQLALLDDENFAKQHPEFVLQDNSGKLILNLVEPQVQAYIKNVIQELMALYDIDGIHFDDYFYSYNGMDDSEDASTYTSYNDGMSLADWRRDNIDTVVHDIYDLIQAYNLNNTDHVKFGISPFGIWKSGGTDGSNTSPYTLQSYSDQYADTKKWVEEGWLDYILPQLYWQFDHGSAPFADLVDWWTSVASGTGVDVIIGHGFYRYDDDSWDDDNELLEQLRYISQYDEVIGSSFFTYNTLLSSDAEVVQALERLNNYYWTDYVTFPWESTVEPEEPLVCEDGYHEEDGECVLDPIVCDDGYSLVDGECVLDPIVCDDGYSLVDGECVLDPLVCEDGYSEVDGECVLDPIVCDSGYELVDGECQLMDEPDPDPDPDFDSGCFGTIGRSTAVLVSVIGLIGFSFVFLRRRSI